jgi:hypothetical protein
LTGIGVSGSAASARDGCTRTTAGELSYSVNNLLLLLSWLLRLGSRLALAFDCTFPSRIGDRKVELGRRCLRRFGKR